MSSPDTLTTETAPSHPGRLKRLAQSVAQWLATCRDYYAAAALYEELSRLSDAELARRGLNRASLGWDVCKRPHEKP